MQKKEIKQNEKIKIFLSIIGTALGVYLLFKLVLPLVWPFILAYFIVVGIMPIVLFLNKRLRLPKPLAGGITLAVIIGILLTILKFIGIKIIEQVSLLVRNIPIYQEMIIGHIQDMCSGCDEIFGLNDGSFKGVIDHGIDKMVVTIQNNFMPAVTERTLSMTLGALAVIGIIVIIVISVILILQDIDSMKKLYKRFLLYEELHVIIDRLANAGFAYLRSQSILMLITAIICTIGLFFIHNEYALLAGMLIAVFDAFPVLGSGFVLVPWAVVMVVSKDIYGAAVLMSIYLLCQLIRQLLEPKLLGNRIGVKPIFTIMAMYVGLNLFGIIGFILGPVALILIITIIKMLCPFLNEEQKNLY